MVPFRLLKKNEHFVVYEGVGFSVKNNMLGGNQLRIAFNYSDESSSWLMSK